MQPMFKGRAMTLRLQESGISTHIIWNSSVWKIYLFPPIYLSQWEVINIFSLGFSPVVLFFILLLSVCSLATGTLSFGFCVFRHACIFFCTVFFLSSFLLYGTILYFSCWQSWNHPFPWGALVPFIGGWYLEMKIWVLDVTVGVSLLPGPLSGRVRKYGCVFQPLVYAQLDSYFSVDWPTDWWISLSPCLPVCLSICEK